MPKTPQSGFRQNDRVELSVVEFLHPRFDVAPVFQHLQVRSNVQQLSLPTRAAGSDSRSCRQHIKRHRLQPLRDRDIDMSRQDQCIGDWRTLRNPGQFQSVRRVSGQVFQAMNSEVRSVTQHRVLNFFSKDALPAHRSKGRRPITVADR